MDAEQKLGKKLSGARASTPKVGDRGVRATTEKTKPAREKGWPRGCSSDGNPAERILKGEGSAKDGGRGSVRENAEGKKILPRSARLSTRGTRRRPVATGSPLRNGRATGMGSEFALAGPR